MSRAVRFALVFLRVTMTNLMSSQNLTSHMAIRESNTTVTVKKGQRSSELNFSREGMIFPLNTRAR